MLWFWLVGFQQNNLFFNHVLLYKNFHNQNCFILNRGLKQSKLTLDFGYETHNDLNICDTYAPKINPVTGYV
jgi:hypothetical protein